MAEYYPLLFRAVAGLRDAKPEAREAIYARARNALLGQLRSMQPAVPEEDIQRESTALDAAIARIETELKDGSPSPAPSDPALAAPPEPKRPEPPPPEPARPQPAFPEPVSPQPAPPEPAASLPAPPEPATPEPAPPQPARVAVEPRRSAPVVAPVVAGVIRPRAPVAGTAPEAPPVRPVAAIHPAAPRASAPKARPAGGASPGLRVSPRPGLPDAPRLEVPVAPSVTELEGPSVSPSAATPSVTDDAERLDPPQPMTRPGRDDGVRPAAPRPVSREAVSPRALIVALVAAIVVAGIAYTAWRLRDRPEALARSRAALEAAQTAEQPQPGKIVSRAEGGAPASAAPPTIQADRTPVGQAPAQPGGSAPATAVAPAPPTAQSDTPASVPTAPETPAPLAPAPSDTTAAAAPETAPANGSAVPPPVQQGASTDTTEAGSSAPAPAPAPAPASPDSSSQATQSTAVPVAQRAALLVEAPEEAQKVKTLVGSVVWRSDNVSSGPGQPIAAVVRAEIDIPEAFLKLSVLFQKNYEAQFPASHTIELRFTPLAGNTLGNVKQINVPQMRKDDAAVGDPLAGVPVTITDNYFLVGLTRGDVEGRNLELIKTRNWFDVSVLLASGKVAKITFEKGATGQRIIDETLQSWQ